MHSSFQSPRTVTPSRQSGNESLFGDLIPYLESGSEFGRSDRGGWAVLGMAFTPDSGSDRSVLNADKLGMR
ncbi:hypothetical protein R3Q06_33870 [Rhodococcus erythropolis]|uniref:hypothetical protein n=1 Tax=Rhodococcus erythropolis TaxID=1833 RepID=UPI002948E011|nr:hypothetical protein [Rhodococcus erythropolis]MDV6278414.1 hypothetical protein [Rhodococcus erythropolis]